MAAVSQCIYCFEVLAASLEHRKPLSLEQTDQLWELYTRDSDAAADSDSHDGDEAPTQDPEQPTANTLSPPQPATHRNLLSPSPASSSSTPSLQSSTSSTRGASDSGRSSHTSLSSRKDDAPPQTTLDRDASHPLFVTWTTHNTRSRTQPKSLRGCIGTFESQPLASGLKTYALTAAFEDTRFHPISARELPQLECDVTLLTDFEPCGSDPMAWTLGTHGLRISFQERGKRYGATYLPDVPREQGWDKEETIVSLMRKAGWNGRREEWRGVEGLSVVRYQGKKVSAEYEDWRAWRDWVSENGLLEDAGKGRGKLAAKLHKMWE